MKKVEGFTPAGQLVAGAFLRFAAKAAEVKGVTLKEFLEGLPWEEGKEEVDE